MYTETEEINLKVIQTLGNDKMKVCASWGLFSSNRSFTVKLFLLHRYFCWERNLFPCWSVNLPYILCVVVSSSTCPSVHSSVSLSLHSLFIIISHHSLIHTVIFFPSFSLPLSPFLSMVRPSLNMTDAVSGRGRGSSCWPAPLWFWCRRPRWSSGSTTVPCSVSPQRHTLGIQRITPTPLASRGSQALGQGNKSSGHMMHRHRPHKSSSGSQVMFQIPQYKMTQALISSKLWFIMREGF